MSDSAAITANLENMYGRDDWIMRFNFQRFLTLSGLDDMHRDVRILDLGCAMGHFIVQLKQRGFADITGLDASEAMVAHARTLTDTPIVHALAQDCATHFEPESFDVIVISDLLHHLDAPALWDRLLDSCASCLRPTGRLIIREPWPIAPVNLLIWMSRHPIFYRLPMLASRLRSFVEEKELVDLFFREWVPSYQERLHAHGFRITRDLNWLVHHITTCARSEA